MQKSLIKKWLMIMKINKCPRCGRYTLKENCCDKTKSCHPPKFSLDKERRYGKYRRKANVK
jgi:H/ACA ribonucleoprotein complex subunit 3